MVKYKNYEDAIPAIMDWLKTQPHLPQIELIFLKTFLSACDGDLEKAQRLIDLNYSMRNTYPHIFIERDPFDEGSKITMESYNILTLPRRDPHNHIIHLSHIVDPDPEKFHHTPSIRLFFMLADSRLSEEDPNGDSAGEVSIFDMNNFTLKHLSRMNLTTIRAFMKFVQEGISVKVKGVHVINVPSFIDKVMTLVKPFIGAELFKIIHFHLPNSETLYEFIPKELLPVEFGGNSGTLAELKAMQLQRLERHKNYLMDEKYWRINESLRPANQQRPDSMAGNFKKLDFD